MCMFQEDMFECMGVQVPEYERLIDLNPN